MIRMLDEWVKKSLYFSVATTSELFYIDKLKQIRNLDLHIHVTREEVEWYEKWRVNIWGIDATKETEWYLCWNPNMIIDVKNKLQERGFHKVYSEEFN